MYFCGVCSVELAQSITYAWRRPKREVYAAYGMPHWVTNEQELDHLIPLELGGSNGIKNLWPEPYGIQWNAHAKDALEDRLHQMVCNEGLPLATAQQWIASNWIEAYKRVFGVDSPKYVQKIRRRRRSSY
jgi:hypothetical protein